MLDRRQNRVSGLAIVLPHPPLPRRRSSLLSQASVSSPHTPRSSACGSPTCQSWFFATSNRKSSDSWNSSNQDVGEDCDSEWKPDQVLLLSRTLDALPSHLVTPFNGPIPPSNLLDRIARGVAEAKGPVEWQHSLRATRVKLIEIARQRAKEDSSRHSRVTDENDHISCYSTDSDFNSGLGRRSSMGITKRPLYRQSSMDFIKTDDHKTSDSINRLSTRLQRTDSLISNQSFHPYTRSRARAQSQLQASNNQMDCRSSSPPRPGHVPSLISPSTPSSSTLNSLSSLSTSAVKARMLRRSPSSLTTSDSSMISASDVESKPSLLPSSIPGPVDPRVQRVRRSESFCAPSYFATAKEDFSASTPPPTRHTFKRAPSYGTLAQEARDKEKEKRASGIYGQLYRKGSREQMNTSPCPSSDEEEKLRDRQAKKAKGLRGKPNKEPVSTAIDTPKVIVGNKIQARKTKTKGSSPADTKSGSPKSRRPSAPSTNSATPTVASSRAAVEESVNPPPRMNLQRNPSIFGDELPHLHIPFATSSSTLLPSATPAPNEDTTRKVRTLRRVKRMAVSRRISFGSLVPRGDEADIEEDAEDCEEKLGSAFQLA